MRHLTSYKDFDIHEGQTQRMVFGPRDAQGHQQCVKEFPLAHSLYYIQTWIDGYREGFDIGARRTSLKLIEFVEQLTATLRQPADKPTEGSEPFPQQTT